MRKMFVAPSRATAAALYRRIEEESNEFSSRLTTHAANSNMTLNRWHNILPYDTTRVVILPRNPTNTSNNIGGCDEMSNSGLRTDYINANHVRVPEASKHYILTQGPIDKDDQRQRTLSSSMMLMLGTPGGGNFRSETVPHFWMMAWQQKSPAIVMLCRTHERDAYGCLQCKCAKYWPKSTSEDDTMRVQDLEIRLIEEQTPKSLNPAIAIKDTSPSSTGINNESCHADSVSSQYTVMRKLEVRQPSTNEKRYVTQYHYQKWPDFGVPEGKEVGNFLKLVNLVGEENPSRDNSPNIIHCSAGVGRSGTFCLVDSCLERMARTGEPITQEQVIDTLLNMRQQRMGLIQTDDQLRFALLAISAGADDALQRARAPGNTKDLKPSSNNVPSNSNHSKRDLSPSSIKDNAYSCNENGVMGTNEVGGVKTHNIICVEGVRAVSSNGKTRIKDGIVASNLARKRSTDLGTEDEEYNQHPPSSLNDGSAVVKEVDEGTEEDIATNTSPSNDNTTARSTAKRKKSERDC